MNAADFYNGMSDDYHLIGSDWQRVVQTQAQIINNLIKGRICIGTPLKVLDCSCGIGTQSIGLAQLGYNVLGTDVSERARNQARGEAERLKLNCHFSVDDMRILSTVNGQFDVIMSFDNSIAHLLHDTDLHNAFKAMKDRLVNDGKIFLSLRDYDELSKSRPSGTLPRLMQDQFGERVYVQTWDWSEDGSCYDLNLFVLKNIENLWQAKPLKTRMRAYKRAEVELSLKAAGFKHIDYLSPSQTGFYQPIIVAN